MVQRPRPPKPRNKIDDVLNVVIAIGMTFYALAALFLLSGMAYPIWRIAFSV